MKRENCWQVKKCGREPNGNNVRELGVCPASIETRLDGTNHGTNGGRCCWALEGTLCDSQVQGTFLAKYKRCLKCEFFQKVSEEEKETGFAGINEIFEKLK